jgi:hypothetical protein
MTLRLGWLAVVACVTVAVASDMFSASGIQAQTQSTVDRSLLSGYRWRSIGC